MLVSRRLVCRLQAQKDTEKTLARYVTVQVSRHPFILLAITHVDPPDPDDGALFSVAPLRLPGTWYGPKVQGAKLSQK